jgi:protein disulfide-isomerase
LDKDVYSKKEFLDYAKKNVVLVKVDFPKTKTQSKALKEANQKLMDKYGVEAFPTAVILGSDAKLLGKEVGYKPLKEVVATLDKYVKQK